MLILTNVELTISDYENKKVKAGALINVSEEVGKKIIKAGYGVKKEIEDLEADKKDLTVAEIKEILDNKGVEYDPKAKKEELIKLLPKK